MKNALKNAFIFAIGATVGSVVTWKILKVKYEQIAQEDIDDVKSYYRNREKKLSEQVDEAHEKLKENNDNDKVPDKGYAKIVNSLGYSKYSDVVEQPEEMKVMDKPYVIPPEDFGDNDDYERIELTYYADHILTDENGEIIEDVDRVVGSDSLSHFGEYEDDSVHVRDDVRGCDYEILKDHRKYSDVLKTKPHLGEV